MHVSVFASLNEHINKCWKAFKQNVRSDKQQAQAREQQENHGLVHSNILINIDSSLIIFHAAPRLQALFYIINLNKSSNLAENFTD